MRGWIVALATCAACTSFGSTGDEPAPAPTTHGDGGAAPGDAQASDAAVDARPDGVLTPTAEIACDGKICKDGTICCEHGDGSDVCVPFAQCTAGDDIAVLCDDPTDCATGTCCVHFQDVYHVGSVTCGACATGGSPPAFQTCNPTRADCAGSQACVTLDTATDNDLALTIDVCK